MTAPQAGWPPPGRYPLATNQHILHLLLTVFTAGMWAPAWIILAIRGNIIRPPVDPGPEQLLGPDGQPVSSVYAKPRKRPG